MKAGETPGFRRFKSFDRFPGFAFKSHGDGWRFKPHEDWRNGTLSLSGIGQLRARGKARQGGEIRASQILHRQGTWYLSLTLDVAQPERERSADGAMAFDWGVETLLTGLTHTGETVIEENPRWYLASKDQVAQLQRTVSSKKNRRSKRRRKAVARLGAAKARQARCRLDWQHKLTATLAKRFALVATEKLQVSNMTRSAAGTAEEPGNNVRQKAGLNREILDTAPALFTQLLRYKVQETGGEWVEAPTSQLKPSQRCPACWGLAKKALAQRVHECKTCGHTEPRDLASARVVLRYALEITNGQELAETGSSNADRENPIQSPNDLGEVVHTAPMEGITAFRSQLERGEMMPVGTVEYVQEAMSIAGIDISPSPGFPTQLQPWLHRSITRTTLANLPGVRGRTFVSPWRRSCSTASSMTRRCPPRACTLATASSLPRCAASMAPRRSGPARSWKWPHRWPGAIRPGRRR